jgi:hypothetical protein
MIVPVMGYTVFFRRIDLSVFKNIGNFSGFSKEISQNE